MAWLDKVFIEPVLKTVNPEVKCRAELILQNNNEVPGSFSGVLSDTNDIRLASLSSWSISDRTTRSIGINNSRNDGHLYVDLYFHLSSKSLDYIDSIREGNSERDVKIKLVLNCSILKSRSSGANIYAHSEPDSKHISRLFRYQGPNGPHEGRDIEMISTDQGAIFDIIYHEFNKPITVTSSDWAQKFCPALGIGKFATVDLFLPDIEEADSILDSFLNDAIRTVQKMEKYINAGEWTSVIEESRKLAEVLREKDNKSFEHWKELLMNSGYHDDALEMFFDMVQNLFQFSSKFVHRINFNKDLRGQVKVEKEDAYFIYSTSMGLVNLLSRKVQESKSLNS